MLMVFLVNLLRIKDSLFQRLPVKGRLTALELYLYRRGRRLEK
jgi:hypothetical protein